MANDIKWTLRSYQDGDEAEILKLWRQVFRRDRSIDHWNWKFKNNPYAKAQAVLACSDPDGKIIGQYTSMPVKLNYIGKPLLACQGLDLMVHPDYRYQGIFLEAEQFYYNKLRKDEMCLVYGFPHENSDPGFSRRLAYKRISHLKRYSFRLGIYQDVLFLLRQPLFAKAVNFGYTLLRSIWLRPKLRLQRFILRKRLGQSPTEAQSKTVPEGYDKFWNFMRSYDILSIWKDSEYLSWRYDQNPDNDFKYFYLVQDGKIIALAVLTEQPNEDIMIYEWLIQRRDVQLGQLLLNHIVSYYAGQQYRRIRFIGKDAGFFDEVFASFSAEILFYFVFHAKALNGTELNKDFAHPHNWTITFGDMDS